jgi:putative pre-16S rRNA nuclease
MSKGLFLGFDFGMKRIGTAVGQAITQKARPLKVVNAKKGEPQWPIIDKLIEEWQPQALIVGIPRKMDDTPLFTTEKAQSFAKALAERYQLPIHEVDERLTTKEARENLFNEGGYQALQESSVDCYAAKIILEQWLGTQKD